MAQAPSSCLVSQNYFRPEWAALGQRRLKNVTVLLEWLVEDSASEAYDDLTLPPEQVRPRVARGRTVARVLIGVVFCSRACTHTGGRAAQGVQNAGPVGHGSP